MAFEMLTYKTPHLLYRHLSGSPRDVGTGGAHTHNLFELIYLVKGDAVHITEDRKYKLAKGDLVIVPPQCYHDLLFESEKEYERYNLLFDADALGLSLAREVSGRFTTVNLADRPTTAMIFQKLDTYRLSLSDEDFGRALSHLLFELFYDLSLLAPVEEREYAVLHPLLSRALAYIRENLFSVTGVSEVAAALFVTDSYLFRLFREQLKVSPKKYINDKRLLAAQSLIRLGHRPSEVYLECGFSDYTAFWRGYKRLFGVAPSQDHR